MKHVGSSFIASLERILRGGNTVGVEPGTVEAVARDGALRRVTGCCHAQPVGIGCAVLGSWGFRKDEVGRMKDERVGVLDGSKKNRP